MLIIGVTGTLGAGKGTVVAYLVAQRKFNYFSVRDFLSKEIKKKGIEVNRDTLTATANEMRLQYGDSYITDSLYDLAVKGGGNAIIESIRAVGEIDSLRQKAAKNEKDHFILLSVDAPAPLRYQRIIARKSETDHIDFETFLANEQREMQNEDPRKQNLLGCMAQADICIDNGGNIEELHKQIEALVPNSETRPEWDEYFMGLCRSVARRATCNRGKSGCVIVKDKQILVTGYVGSPSHLPHCDEQGHLFRKILHNDGHISTHCVRTVHAEQNAICQAAKRGIALEGSTLYCTMTPCRTCAMLIINCGVKQVICEYHYHAGDESEQMLKQAGISLRYFHHTVLEYTHQ